MSAPRYSPARHAALMALVKKPAPPTYGLAPVNRHQRRLVTRELRKAAQSKLGKK
jgi:hypothetical protein